MATLERTELGDVTVVKLKGSLTMEGLEEVQDQFQELTRRPGCHTLVDLTEVEMVTTPALSMFLAAASAAKNQFAIFSSDCGCTPSCTRFRGMKKPWPRPAESRSGTARLSSPKSPARHPLGFLPDHRRQS